MKYNYTSESLEREMGRKRQTHHSSVKENSEEETSLKKIFDRYPELDLHAPFPSLAWWQTFFDKGSLDTQELEESLSNSKYFQDENTPNWVKLWHFAYLNDNDFDNLLTKVESEYAGRKYIDLGVIKHITGLFLKFSNEGLYCKSKEEVLQNSKLYINELAQNNQLEILPQYISLNEGIEHMFGSYLGLGFQGKEFREFKDFCSYMDEALEQARVKNLPSAAQDLLATMQSDVWKFDSMICSSGLQTNQPEQRYYNIPILKYIEPTTFVKKLLLMKFDDQRHLYWALTERYKFDDINKKLLEELEWLKSVRSLLLEEASHRKGKVSGYSLRLLIENYLNEVIEKLEVKNQR